MAAEQVDPRLDHRHSDLEFLKDQVQRLSDALSRYQEKYPPVSTDGQRGLLNSDGPRPAWLYNKSLLAPLIAEYDSVISQQTKELNLQKAAIEGLTSKLKIVCEDNAKLQDICQRSAEAGHLSSGRGGGRRSLDVDLVDHLQQQLESVKEERTSYQKMAEANEEELREMQKVYRDVSVLNKHFKEDLASTKLRAKEAESVSRKLQGMCQVLEQERVDLLSKVSSQDSEIHSLQQEQRLASGAC
jgi:chromosome segregation ATPase